MASKFPTVYLRRLCTSSASQISISRAKSKLRSEFNPDKALDLYTSSSSQHHTSSSLHVQILTVRRLAKSNRFPEIQTLIESHKQNPQITQEPYLSTIIRSYGEAGMFQQALSTYHDMEKFNTPRSSLSFNALLSAFNHSKQFSLVPNMFSEFPFKYSFEPDEVTYSILINSLCEMGSPEKAIEILDEMDRKRIKVTTVSFTTILSTLYKKEKVERAEWLWRDRKGKGCVFDVGAYNVRIMHACDGKPEIVEAMIDDIIELGMKPDTISFNYLMGCYCKNDMMEQAMKVYNGFDVNKCRRNTATYRILISEMCRMGDFEGSYKVFKKSVQFHRIPDFGTMSELLVGLVKNSRKKDFREMMRTVKKKFPDNLLNDWRKLEEDLGLVPK